MARNRFVTPEVIRIPLTDGDWIETKKYLNTGDQKRLEAAGNGVPVRLSDGSIHTPIDWAVYELERAAIFLLDWSFRGADDKPVPLKNKDGEVSLDALRALDPESFDEVNKAIFDHVVERAKEKNAQRVTQQPTSGLPDAEQKS